MTLKDWMRLRRVRAAEVAQAAKVSESVVRAWARGARRPSLDHVEEIWHLTGGEVSPVDWMVSRYAIPARRLVLPHMAEVA